MNLLAILDDSDGAFGVVLLVGLLLGLAWLPGRDVGRDGWRA